MVIIGFVLLTMCLALLVLLDGVNDKCNTIVETLEELEPELQRTHDTLQELCSNVDRVRTAINRLH